MSKYSCKTFVYISVFFVLVSNTSLANVYYSNIERFSVSNGLPDNTIYSVKKDKTGFVWLGTPKGLTRFDGNKFKVYSTKTTNNKLLQYDGASNIFIDSKQQFWIGTWAKGLSVYDSSLTLIKSFQHKLNDPSSLCSNKVQSFFEDSQGTLWLGTNNGLCRYNHVQHTFTSFIYAEKNNHSLSHNRVWQIVEAKNGILWIATSNGLNKMSLDKPGYFIRYMQNSNTSKSLSNSQIRSLLVDKKDHLWVGTEGGFGQYDKNNNRFIFISPKSKNLILPITHITEGIFNDIWIATQQGLYRYLPANKKFASLENEKLQMFHHDDIRDIIIEKNGIMWLATRFSGLLKVNYSPNSFNFINQFRDKNNTKKNLHNVTAFMEDHDGTVWVSADEGILFRKKNSADFNLFQKSNVMSPYRINSLVEDSEHQIWVAGGAGLFLINSQRSQITDVNHFVKKFKNRGLRKVLYDNKKQLWVISYFNGLAKIAANKTKYYQHNTNIFTSIASDVLNDIIEDQAGQIWIATDSQGIDRVDQNIERFIHYPISATTSTTNENINTLYQNKNKQLYAGTQNGLFILNTVNDSFELIQNNTSLQSNNIKAIIEDSENNLWLTTSSGISLYKQGQNNLNFNKKDGIFSDKFLERSIFKMSNDNLLFGANNGVTILNPSIQQQTRNKYNTVITEVIIDQKPLSQYQFSPQNALQLTYQTKTIQIEFAYLNYNKTATRHYQYHLKNFDTNTFLHTKNNNITYNNLPPGKYEFFVTGADATQTMQYQRPKLVFIIKPPWWQLWWVQIIALMLSFLFLVVIVKIRTKTINNQKHHLEKIIKQRSLELIETQKQLVNSEKNIALSSLVTGVAHEINTPVGIGVTAASHIVETINELLESYENKSIDNKMFKYKTAQIKEGADIVLHNLKRASDLISSFKLVSVDQSSEEQRQFNVLEYINNILMSLSPKLKKQAINIELNCPESIFVLSYPGAFAQVITNLILNTSIHAFENIDNKKVTITVYYQDNWLKIKICDNGNGIAEDKISQIFDPFFTTKRGQGGSGLGLHIVQNIITQKFEGKIECISELNKGCCFHLKLLLPQAN